MRRINWAAAAALPLLLCSLEPALAHHVMGGRMPANAMEGLLSGLGHPIIGFDHLAAVIAIGCLAATQVRGALLVVGYVVAMLIGAALHVRELTVPAMEVLVALSLLVLGGILVRARPSRPGLSLGLFVIVGLIHGYALGETIVGAQPAPLYAYFIGLAVIQGGIALAVMAGARLLLSDAMRPRLVGAAVVGVGLAALAAQLAPGV